MNRTWGYRTSDNDWKSAETLIRNLVDIASKGGNYLLNVGPKPDGTFPEESVERLKAIGDWMDVNSEAIYATKASPLKPLDWGRCTMKKTKGGTTLYLSVFDWPKNGKLLVPGLGNEVISASLLGGKSKLSTKSTKKGLAIDAPETPVDPIATVIKLEVKGNVKKQTMKAKKAMKTGALD
jgi:alpha-L-fucosidase